MIYPPAGVTISKTAEETRINIGADIDYGEYNITVKAKGTGDYNGETGATFKLNITRIALTGLSTDVVSVAIGTTFFDIPSPTPSGATVDYELITKPTGVTIDGTTINITADMGIGEYNITVKTTGKGDYNGEIITNLKLTIVFKNDDFVIPFRDFKFKNAVKSYYGITANDVTYGDLKDKTDLNIANKQIENIDEIIYFTSLRELHCYGNQLTSLDISQNTDLEILYCYDNQLTSLDLRQNTVLTYLICNNTQLTSLDLSQNTVLKYLTCDNTQLTSLDLSQNTVLKYLICSGNQLTSLDMRGVRSAYDNLNFNNTTLETLKVHRNIKDDQRIIDLKTAIGSNVTISTYSATAGSTTYELICNDYNPRVGGGTCNN